MTAFYYLKHELYHTYLSAIAEQHVEDPERCAVCGEFVGMMRWLPPYCLELELWSDNYGDLAFSSGEALMTTERLRSLFLRDHLTGVSHFEKAHIVRAVRKTHRAPDAQSPTYYVVRVARGGAAIDQVASEFDWEEPPRCSACRIGRGLKRWQRVVIDPATWSGEDIFYARGMSGAIFTSQRFKDFCDRHKITNATLIPAEEYEHDFYPWENTKRAEELAAMPLSNDLREKTKPNGEEWRYFIPKNELVIINADGTIQTMFRPLEGLKYWNEQ